jgi:CRP-like cAMP-binding protein
MHILLVVHQAVTCKPACSYFGELALLYDQPRAATVRATAKCKLWVMERSIYNSIFRQEVKELRAAKMALIKSTPIFNTLTETLQGSLCDSLQPLEKEANSVLFYKGDEGQLFYIVKEGTVEISIGDKVRCQTLPPNGSRLHLRVLLWHVCMACFSVLVYLFVHCLLSILDLCPQNHSPNKD